MILLKENEMKSLLNEPELSIATLKSCLGLSALQALAVYGAWTYEYGGVHLRQVDKRHRKATKGPWRVTSDPSDGYMIWSESDSKKVAKIREACKDEAEWIAYLRSAIPYARIIQLILQMHVSILEEKKKPFQSFIDLTEPIEKLTSSLNVNGTFYTKENEVWLNESGTSMLFAKVYKPRDREWMVHAVQDFKDVMEKVHRLKSRFNDLQRK